MMSLTALVMLLLIVCGCWLWETRAPQRSFTPEDLLVSPQVMPSSWQTLGEPFLPAGDELVSRESTALRFGVADREPPTQAEQAVYRYDSTGIAKRKFEIVYLPQVRYFELVSEWTYQSPIADQSYFGCYNWEGHATPVCEWAGQYEEYIVVFRVHMTPGEVSLTDVERVVRAIDARMAAYLGKPLESGD